MTLARREFRSTLRTDPKLFDLAHGMTLYPCQDSVHATGVLRQPIRRILLALPPQS
jgi:hypothetical protein